MEYITIANGRRVTRNAGGKQGLLEVAAALEADVKFLPREMTKWAQGQGTAKKPGWGMPRCVRSGNIYIIYRYYICVCACCLVCRAPFQSGPAVAPPRCACAAQVPGEDLLGEQDRDPAGEGQGWEEDAGDPVAVRGTGDDSGTWVPYPTRTEPWSPVFTPRQDRLIYTYSLKAHDLGPEGWRKLQEEMLRFMEMAMVLNTNLVGVLYTLHIYMLYKFYMYA